MVQRKTDDVEPCQPITPWKERGVRKCLVLKDEGSKKFKFSRLEEKIELTGKIKDQRTSFLKKNVSLGFPRMLC